MSETTSVRPNKKQRVLTGEAFDGLLDYLAPNQREEAARKYEELRLSLLTYFATRGAADPDELADESLNRVAYRLAEGEIIRAPNPIYYVLAVARNVWREQLAQPQKLVSFADLPQELAVPIASPEELLLEFEQRLQAEQKYDCFAQCLAVLAETDRTLLTEYHQGRGRAQSQQRQAMAKQFGVTLGSLRNRVSRIRERLATCVQECMEQETKV